MLNNRNDKYGFYKDEHGIDEFELSPYQRAFMEYRLEKDTCLYVCMGLRIRGKLNLKTRRIPMLCLLLMVLQIIIMTHPDV